MIKQVDKKQSRQKIKSRIRAKVTGTAERPRLSVYRSNKNIYAQLIDDVSGVTLAASSTKASSIAEAVNGKSGIERAIAVGTELGKIALEKGIVSAVFDRNGFRYHGKVKALADAAREAGLKF